MAAKNGYAPGGVAADTLVFDFRKEKLGATLTGFSGAEPIGRWTDGKRASIAMPLPPSWRGAGVLLIHVDLRGFIDAERVPEQRVTVRSGSATLGQWTISEAYTRTRGLALERAAFADTGSVELTLDLHDCAQPSVMGISSDARRLAVMIERISLARADALPPPESFWWQLGRPVGGEAAKSFDARVHSGFWSRFIGGRKVLDVGFRGYGGGALPILDGAIGVDLDYPGYDGRRLPFEDGSQDAVFSSHCLEHIPDYVNAIQDWYRVTKPGGHIITVVPNACLYERKRRPPSRWNDDHKRFYSPASLLTEFASSLAPNSYRVRLLEENDAGYRYGDAPDVHPFGCYEIVLVIQKITPPAWDLGA